MSIMMFIPNPEDDSEKRLNVPVLTEETFHKIVLPAAERIGAGMVCSFGLGLEVDFSNVRQLESELRDVLDDIPLTTEVKEYVEPRIHNLITELGRVFESKPNAILYIG